EIVPTPFMRVSMPVIVNTSGVPAAEGWEIVSMPVVHGKPALVAMLEIGAFEPTTTAFAIRPVFFGTLTAWTPDIVATPPGVVSTTPVIAPATASVIGCASTMMPMQPESVPPNKLCLQGGLPVGPCAQAFTTDSGTTLVRDAPPN